MERRWPWRLAPPIAVALAAGLMASAPGGAADAAWEPPPCPAGAGGVPAAVAKATAPGADGAAGWYTMDAAIDGAGRLTGHRLRIGVGRDRAAYVALPPESSAAGPFGRVVLVAADDGRASRLRAIDRSAGCAWDLGTSGDVVRTATLDPNGPAVYEHRVDRRSRADLGVWRRPLGGGPVARVLPPPPDDPAIGATWVTILAWNAEGDRLAVQSCGARRCRTRLLDPVRGTVTAPDAAAQGELVGVGGGRIVAYGPCPGLPCPVLAWAGDGTDPATLDERGGTARLVQAPGGPLVAVEAAPGSIDVLALDGRRLRTLGLPERLRLLPAPHRASAGASPPAGWLALSPDARSPVDAVLARIDDGSPTAVLEVSR